MSVDAARWFGAKVSAALAAAAALGLALGAHAQPAAPIGAAEIESRVREIYIEGYPVDDAKLSREAIDRLGAMLADPAETPYWSNIVLALGASESRHAYPYLAAFAAQTPSGEVSADLYSARVSLRVALGQLGHSNRESLALLAQMARDERGEPGWRFQSLHGPTLAGALRRSAVTGLAVSGSAEAEAVFDEIEAATGGTGELADHVQASRMLHQRAVDEGPRSLLRRVGP